ncbi:MAG: hypothetical protein IPJ82_15215 [Lewinellaceae bacterium]|nr:hypothetical protein [Lewinellaceae bacterium]
MLRSFFFLIFSLSLVCCQTVQPQNDETTSTEEAAPAIRYAPSSLQKMHWLAGIWKGEEAGQVTRQFFQFHNDRTLEVMYTDEDGDLSSLAFTWFDGSYYYGTGRRWLVTWIGEKDVRFDPMHPDAEPMTWTRLNDQQWHLIRHTPSGDKATLMERTDEMQP